MKFHSKAVAATALCALFALPLIVVAQVPVNAHPKKAAPPAALVKPAIVGTTVRPIGGTPLMPPKPPVVTAVAPWHPLVHDTHSGIIFVGGKPQGGSQVELNPQPIPPGYGGPVDPSR